MTQENRLGDVGARRQQLHQLLRSAPPPESECEAYLPRLADYVDAQLAGEDYLTRYPDVANHLDSCQTCADSYARLYDLEVALVTAALPAPRTIPTPDLSFLSRSGAKSSRSVVDLLAEGFTTTANRIRLQLTAELLALLQPQQAAALTRSSVGDSRYNEMLYELRAKQYPASAIPVSLTAYRDAEQPEQCLLEVTVVPAGERWPNLGGRTVTLEMGSNRMTATTDAWGVALFEGVPIAGLGEVSLVIGLTK